MRFRPNAMRMACVDDHAHRRRLFSLRSRRREAWPAGHEGLLVYNACGSPSDRDDKGAARTHCSLSPAIGPRCPRLLTALLRPHDRCDHRSLLRGCWCLVSFGLLALAAEREALRYQLTAVALTDTSAPTCSSQRNHSAPWSRDTHLVDKLSSTADEVSTQKQRVAVVLSGSHRNAALS